MIKQLKNAVVRGASSLQRMVRRRLCDNPTCSAHCEVEHRAITTDGEMAWCMASGFRMPLTKEQLMHFRPESKLNVCGRCKGGYEHMLNRARQIARRKLKPESHVVWWLPPNDPSSATAS